MKRLNSRQLPIALATVLLLAACASFDEQDIAGPAAGAPAAVTIMTFNVQNLFDTTDDPDKDDKAYLPIAAKQNQVHIAACNQIEVASWRDECLNLDWSDAAVDYKLSVIADTIRTANSGLGTDIIALQEIENSAILERLRTDYLADLGYDPAVLIEGSDARGIDVAFLSRMPLVGTPVLHPLALPGFPDREKDTRGVLQADFRLANGAILTGFSVHFPAPFHPTAMRIAAYEHLNDLLAALPADRVVFAGGDFNTTSREDKEQKMLDKYVRPSWTIAHDIGCKTCTGTHYYARGDSWSFLDMLLLAKTRGENTTAEIRADSVRIANRNPAQISTRGTPERFSWAERKGVSDHWPMIATIELTEKQ